MRDAETWSEADWSGFLSEELRREVKVRYTRARRTVLRAEHGSDAVAVSMNGMFADAPRDVRESLARWLRSGRRARRACELLDRWIDERLARLHAEEPSPLRLESGGRVHDLAALASELYAAGLFPDLEDGERPRIGWGRATRSRSRHTLRLGSYDYHARVVRVHPVLDQEAVPEWFVRSVVHHELVHAAVDRRDADGRRAPHGPEFREREKRDPSFERSRKWEREHIDALIRSARTGRPLEVRRRHLAAVGRWVQETLF